jgi:hypothetical protein
LGPLNLLCRKARQRGTYQLAMGARRLAKGLGVVGGACCRGGLFVFGLRNGTVQGDELEHSTGINTDTAWTITHWHWGAAILCMSWSLGFFHYTIITAASLYCVQLAEGLLATALFLRLPHICPDANQVPPCKYTLPLLIDAACNLNAILSKSVSACATSGSNSNLLERQSARSCSPACCRTPGWACQDSG